MVNHGTPVNANTLLATNRNQRLVKTVPKRYAVFVSLVSDMNPEIIEQARPMTPTSSIHPAIGMTSGMTSIGDPAYKRASNKTAALLT